MAAASAELPVCGHEFYAFFYQSIFLVVLESTMVKNVVREVVVTRSRQEMVKMQFFILMISIVIVSSRVSILFVNNRGRNFRYCPALHMCVFLFTSIP